MARHTLLSILLINSLRFSGSLKSREQSLKARKVPIMLSQIQRERKT